MSRPVRLLSILFFLLGALALPVGASAAQNDQPARYIVQFNPDVATTASLPQQLASQQGFAVDLTFQTVVKGFSARLTPGQVRALQAMPNVASVEPDLPTHTTEQQIPTGISRIGALNNPTASIDGVDNPLNIDVAVLDTGIDASHPDLNVAGGYNCTSSDTTAWADGDGHGTHVAGTIAARDNGIGVVGVAPGARLWAIKVFDNNGSGYVSWIICGLDWAAQHAGTIKVANFSGAWSGSNTANCGNSFFRWNQDTAHQAVCTLVNTKGIPFVVAASNDGKDASNSLPAAYPETFAVGAIVDTDGQPGGLGPSTSYGADDTRASFSNYGPVVDFYAPGVNILSTWPGGGLATLSGTSMATPHVTGAVALYLLTHPGASPDQVRQGLTSAGESGSWGSQPLVKVGPNSPTTPVDDVAVTAVTAPSSVVVGVPVTVKVSIKNAGTRTESISVGLTDNSSAVGSAQSISLASGASQDVSFGWTPGSTGSHTLVGSATITTAGAGADPTPSNNTGQTSVNVQSVVHDVAVTSVSAPSTITQGQSGSVTVAVQNVGNQNESNIIVSLTSSPANAAGDPPNQTISLNAGQSTNVTFTWSTSNATATGAYTLTGKVQLSGDSNSANDSKTASTQVNAPSATPAMHVQDISLSSSANRFFIWIVSYNLNGTVTITGPSGPVANATVTLQLSGPGVSTTFTAQTNASGVASFSRTVSSRGTYTVTAQSVTASGYSYDAGANVESSQSISV